MHRPGDLERGCCPVDDGEERASIDGRWPTAQPVGAGGLASAIARAGADAHGPVWLAWEVPASSMGNACCLDRQFKPTTCRLENNRQSWGTNNDSPPGSGRLLVLARWEDGKVERIRHVDTQCPVDPAPLSIVDLQGVAAAESVRWLAGLAAEAESKRDSGEPLAALAHHGEPAADEALERLASKPNRDELREQALFWMGQARGERGARFLADVARHDPDGEIREKAIFSLSQSEVPTAVDTIVEVARNDRDEEVRGHALFWLAQTNAERAPKVLLDALDRDPSEDVRKKAIFAISQLDDGAPILIRIVRERRDTQLRREALFWLGQSKDPRAFDFLADVLEQSAGARLPHRSARAVGSAPALSQSQLTLLDARLRLARRWRPPQPNVGCSRRDQAISIC